MARYRFSWWSLALVALAIAATYFAWANLAALYPVIQTLTQMNSSGGSGSSEDTLATLQTINFRLFAVNHIWFCLCLGAFIPLTILAIAKLVVGQKRKYKISWAAPILTGVLVAIGIYAWGYWAQVSPVIDALARLQVIDFSGAVPPSAEDIAALQSIESSESLQVFLVNEGWLSMLLIAFGSILPIAAYKWAFGQ